MDFCNLKVGIENLEAFYWNILSILYLMSINNDIKKEDQVKLKKPKK